MRFGFHQFLFGLARPGFGRFPGGNLGQHLVEPPARFVHARVVGDQICRGVQEIARSRKILRSERGVEITNHDVELGLQARSGLRAAQPLREVRHFWRVTVDLTKRLEQAGRFVEFLVLYRGPRGRKDVQQALPLLGTLPGDAPVFLYLAARRLRNSSSAAPTRTCDAGSSASSIFSAV